MIITGTLRLDLGRIEVTAQFDDTETAAPSADERIESARQFAKAVGMLARPQSMAILIAALEYEAKRL
jgi:hypothetical protein